MQFSDTSNKTGIIQSIEFRTNLGDAGISGDATLLKQFTAQINLAKKRFFYLALQSSGLWTVDDANHTDLPKATTNLVSGQEDYKILAASPTSTQDWLTVKEVNVKDENGKFYRLNPRSDKTFAEPASERVNTPGQPSTFYMEGTQLFIDPAPNYSSTNGLEVSFDRAPLEYVSTDTTKLTGMPSLFDEFLVLLPTYWWEKYKRVGDSEQTKRDIVEMEKSIGDHFSGRNKYQPNRLKRANNARRK